MDVFIQVEGEKNVEKKIDFTLTPYGSGTRIVTSVELTEDLTTIFKERLSNSIVFSSISGISFLTLWRLIGVMNYLSRKGYISENTIILFMIAFFASILIFIPSLVVTVGYIIELITMYKKKHVFIEKSFKHFHNIRKAFFSLILKYMIIKRAK